VGETPEETYQLNYVGIIHHEIITNNAFSPKNTWWEGYRGKYKRKLGVAEFYDGVARPDLHAAAVRHFTIQLSLIGAGVGLMVGGAIYMGKHVEDNGAKTGLLVAAGGLGFLIAARVISSQPTSEAEAIVMARDYDDRLRQHLGLPPLIEDPSARREPRRPPAHRLVLAPALAPDGRGLGGGLVLGGAF
jgi:hypothetical protein